MHCFVAFQYLVSIGHLYLTLVLNEVQRALDDGRLHKLISDSQKLFEQLAVLLHKLCETVSLNRVYLNI